MYAVIVDLLQLLLLASTLRTWLKVNVNELVEQQWRRPLNYGNNFALPCLVLFSLSTFFSFVSPPPAWVFALSSGDFHFH